MMHRRTKLQLVSLEDRLVPAGLIALGVDAGGGPHVKVFDTDGTELASFFAFNTLFSGGVRVALGDINGDGTSDVIAGSGLNGGTHVVVIDGTQLGQVQATGQIADSALLASFFAFSRNLTGGVYVAAGDVNNDGLDDVIVGAGPGGGPQVIAIDATRLGILQGNGQIAENALLATYFAFEPEFRGGVRVAAGDINFDGRADLVSAVATSGPPRVIAVDAANTRFVQPNGQISEAVMLSSFFAYDLSFQGGVNLAMADVNGDGRSDIITGAEANSGGEVRAFSQGQLLTAYFPLRSVQGAGYNGGVRIGGIDTNADNRIEIWSASTAGFTPIINQTDSLSGAELSRINAFNFNVLTGLFLATRFDMN